MIPGMKVTITDSFKQGFVTECIRHGLGPDITEDLFKAAVACRQLDAPHTKQAFEEKLVNGGRDIPMLAKARAFSRASGQDLY